jgi:hypothetical protein
MYTDISYAVSLYINPEKSKLVGLTIQHIFGGVLARSASNP